VKVVKKIVFVFVALAFLMAIRPVFASVGDVNGDGKVDIKDVLMVSKCFGATPSDPRWNPACDLNGDGKIDIRDILIVATHFGQ
jgi:hypothetical protein